MEPADPAEMFSGDRGPAAAFANITVWIPPETARQVGEVQWPRQVPGNPATDFVTLKADVIDRNQALAWFHRTLRTVPKRQVLVGDVTLTGNTNLYSSRKNLVSRKINDLGRAKTDPVGQLNGYTQLM